MAVPKPSSAPGAAPTSACAQPLFPAHRQSRPSVRARVFCHESYMLGKSTLDGLRAAKARRPGAAPAAPSFAADFRTLWRDPDYRGQFLGRTFTHLGQGMGGGAQMLLLSSTVKLTTAQGLLINSCLSAAELLVGQCAGVWRGLFSDQARNGELSSAAGTADRPTKLGRHQLVTRLMLAGLYEVGIAGCLLGVLFFRGARLLAGRRILLVLACIRVARNVCMTTQWAGFDGLKGQLADPAARRLVAKRWDSTRAVEQAVGLVLNQAAAIACQLVPYVLPCPSMVAAMACMMAAGLVVSLCAKAQLVRYLDEGEPGLADVQARAPATQEPSASGARTSASSVQLGPAVAAGAAGVKRAAAA